MEQPTVRKTFKYKLKPTPNQEQAMAFVLRRCRELYNAALQERKETLLCKSAKKPGRSVESL